MVEEEREAQVNIHARHTSDINGDLAVTAVRCTFACGMQISRVKLVLTPTSLEEHSIRPVLVVAIQLALLCRTVSNAAPIMKASRRHSVRRRRSTSMLRQHPAPLLLPRKYKSFPFPLCFPLLDIHQQASQLDGANTQQGAPRSVNACDRAS